MRHAKSLASRHHSKKRDGLSRVLAVLLVANMVLMAAMPIALYADDIIAPQDGLVEYGDAPSPSADRPDSGLNAEEQESLDALNINQETDVLADWLDGYGNGYDPDDPDWEGWLGEGLEGIGIALDVDTATIKFLVEKCYNPEYGARPIKRLIQTELEDPIAEAVLSGGGKTTARVSMRDGKVCLTLG